MRERKPYILKDLFKGDKSLFKEAFSNPESIIFYDMDGILADTPKVVHKKFSLDNNLDAKPSEINSWDYLTKLAIVAGLDSDKIKHAEDDWYKAEILSQAQNYLYINPVLEKTLKLFSPTRNFVLTSREPFLTDSTIDWINLKYPKILTKNILIRKDEKIKPTEFKANEIKSRALNAPWVIIIDDSTKYIKSIIDTGIDNLLAINIPLGRIKPDFTHPQLVVIKRFPDDIQGMYPLLNSINLVIH